MRRALRIYETSYGPDHPQVASGLNNLAWLLKSTGRFDEAKPLMCRALAIYEKSYPDHPDLAIALNNFALLLQTAGRLAEAEPLMRRALAINEKNFGPGHPNVATVLNNLAALLKETDRLAEAKPLLRREVEIFLSFTQKTGYAHPHLLAALGTYHTLLIGMGRSEAETRTKIDAIISAYGLGAKIRRSD